MYVVLVYDVSKDENGQKRWSHIFKICKKYLSHIQNSVFEGEISVVQLTKMKQELEPYINGRLVHMDNIPDAVLYGRNLILIADWILWLYLKAGSKSGLIKNSGASRMTLRTLFYKAVDIRCSKKAVGSTKH